MRQLTGGSAISDLRIEQAGADALDLVLLESTRVDISRASITLLMTMISPLPVALS